MKILYFINSLLAGGMERQLVGIIKSLTGPGYNYDVILVLMNKEIHYREIFELPVEIRYVIRKWKKDPSVFVKVYKIFKETQPDFIHTFDSLTSFYATFIASTLNIRLINGSVRDAPNKNVIPFLIRLINFMTFPFADIIVSNSKAGLVSYGVKKKGDFIYNSFDFERVKNLTESTIIMRKYAVNTDKIVGMVASFSAQKDYETFIKAAQFLLESRSDITFFAVGDGVKLDECKKLVQEKYSNKIIFTGNLDDVESLVNIFDVAVLTSNILCHGEGISNSIMEYMALGKPVIATRGGGTSEIVDDDISGYLIDPFDHEMLAEKISFLADNKANAVMMGSKGKQIIKNDFSVEKMSEAYAKLYESLINNDNLY